jgi:hypothetical protein
MMDLYCPLWTYRATVYTINPQRLRWAHSVHELLIVSIVVHHGYYNSIMDSNSIMDAMAWVHHGHYGSIMDTMGLSWTLWVHCGHYGYIVDTMGTLWTLALWTHRGPHGFIMDTYGFIVDTMGLS